MGTTEWHVLRPSNIFPEWQFFWRWPTQFDPLRVFLDPIIARKPSKVLWWSHWSMAAWKCDCCRHPQPTIDLCGRCPWNTCHLAESTAEHVDWLNITHLFIQINVPYSLNILKKYSMRYTPLVIWRSVLENHILFVMFFYLWIWGVHEFSTTNC